ncbi:MAG TPA: NAD(P)H-dependent oxidoreductase [Arcobacter sp.]|nr:NAD(P)H-dependent oxidoreductase [Arcobacter sp.]HIP56126.1 NAD(P)H-dependent oxidoreductase [Arcobacter sp.]
MKETFLKAMDFRHACKEFDTSKKISKEDIDFIMQTARKSPSSFGMEPWKFLVITNEQLKEELRPLCWNQIQITSCSHLVVVLSAIDAVKVESGIPLKRFARRDMPEEKLDFYLDLYASHLRDTLNTNENTYAWTSKQTYIALGNMMNAAAFLEIDSCPIEGFEKQKVEELLKLDTNKFQVSVILPLGYRKNNQSEQLRLPFEDVIEFID